MNDFTEDDADSMIFLAYLIYTNTTICQKALIWNIPFKCIFLSYKQSNIVYYQTMKSVKDIIVSFKWSLGSKRWTMSFFVERTMMPVNVFFIYARFSLGWDFFIHSSFRLFYVDKHVLTCLLCSALWSLIILHLKWLLHIFICLLSKEETQSILSIKKMMKSYIECK